MGKGRKQAADMMPRRKRRFRIVAEAGFRGEYPPTRDVYLESETPDGWEVELFDLGKACVPTVADLIRFAESTRTTVEYDPPGNMEKYFQPGIDDDRGYLFT